MKKSKFLTNDEIKGIYRVNENSQSDTWKINLFNNLRGYPVSRVNKNFKKSFFYEDIKQELLMSLWSAILTYDYHKNFDFYRWASWHLSKASRDFLNKESRSLSINVINNYDQHCGPSQELKCLVSEVFCMNNLISEREALILKDNYLYEKTLSEISKELGISIERVRQVRNKAVIKINNYINAEEE